MPSIGTFEARSFLTSLYNLAERKAAETLKKVEDVEILANQKIAALETEYEEKTEDLKNQYDQKLAAALSFFIFYEETVMSVLETIPNEKLQKAVAVFKSKLELKKNEITATIGEIYQNYELAVEHKGEEIRKEYDHKIKFLEDEIKKISLYVNEIKGDNSNGEEREPGETDSNPTQEEIQSNQ